MKKGMLKSLADSRRIKYSTLSLALCAVVIVLVILLNSIVSVLSNRFNWYVDMTKRQMFSLSDDAKAILADINDDVELEIIFPFDEDIIETDYAVSSSSGSIAYIYRTAKEIEKECDNVTVSYHDVIKDYAFYRDIGLHSYAKDTNILILRKNADGKYVEGDFRSYPINYFFVSKSATDNTLYAYNGELVFLSALIAISRDTVPTVYFTIGHNEKFLTGELEELNYGNLASAFGSGLIDSEAYMLLSIFCDSGFTIKPLDIRTQPIPEDARMLVINQPTSDFTDDELYKLTTYLLNGGAAFCFTSHHAQLPGLYATLESNYGIKVNTSETDKVVDDSHRMTNGGVVHYLANVSKDDDSFASAKYFSKYSSYTSANAYYNGAGSLTIDPRYMNTNGYVTGAISKYTYPLLESAPTAVFGGESKVHHLMSITSIDNWSNENQHSVYSYLVVCPSSEFASSVALSQSNANRHMILSLIQTTSSVQTPVNLDYKPFVDYKLTITDSEARTVTVVLATIIPAIIAICGVVVIVRRKHR